MNKVYIEELNLEGIGIYNTPLNKKLKEGFNVIEGERESGKTTLIKSILWGLFDKEYEYFESIQDHKKSYTELKLKFNNEVNTFIKNINGDFEESLNIEFSEYKKILKDFKELLYINDTNFSTEIIPEEIIKYFSDLNIDNEIERTISDYENKSGESYYNDIEKDFIKNQEQIKYEINNYKELIIKNNQIKEKLQGFVEEKKLIVNKKMPEETIKKVKEEYEESLKEYNILKIMLKIKLNNIDVNEKENDISELTNVINDKLKMMVENIKGHFNEKIKNINNNFLEITLNMDDYRYISETLNYIEKYNLNKLDYIIENVSSIKEITQSIIENEENLSKQKDEYKELFNLFETAKELLKFIKNLELSIGTETLNSMFFYYEIDNKKDFKKLLNLNNKYPFYIVYQINNNLKGEFKNSLKESISLEFNESFTNSIETLLLEYLDVVKQMKFKFLTEEEKNIFDNCSPVIQTIEETIEKSSIIIKELNSKHSKIEEEKNKDLLINKINIDIKSLEEESKTINEDIGNENNKDILKTIEELIKNKTKELEIFVKENFTKVELKKNFESKISKIKTDFSISKEYLLNNNIEVINNYIKTFNPNYSIEIIDNKIYFLDGDNKLPIQISKKEQKIIYKIALSKFMNDFLNLINQNIILLIDDAEDLINKSEFENIKKTLSKEDKYQIIFTQRNN